MPLVVRDRDNREDVVVGTTPEGGLIQLRGPSRESGLITLGYVDNTAALRFFDSRGRLRVSPIGGVLGPRRRPGQDQQPPQGPPADNDQPQPAEPEPGELDP